jgi:5-deoxy-glucuronate isomerase
MTIDTRTFTTTVGEMFQLPGRASAFESAADFERVPRDARAHSASGAGGLFALAGAKCERQLPARYGPAPEVPVSERRCRAPRTRVHR